MNLRAAGTGWGTSFMVNSTVPLLGSSRSSKMTLLKGVCDGPVLSPLLPWFSHAIQLPSAIVVFVGNVGNAKPFFQSARGQGWALQQARRIVLVVGCLAKQGREDQPFAVSGRVGKGLPPLPGIGQALLALLIGWAPSGRSHPGSVRASGVWSRLPPRCPRLPWPARVPVCCSVDRGMDKRNGCLSRHGGVTG